MLSMPAEERKRFILAALATQAISAMFTAGGSDDKLPLGHSVPLLWLRIALLALAQSSPKGSPAKGGLIPTGVSGLLAKLLCTCRMILGASLSELHG